MSKLLEVERITVQMDSKVVLNRVSLFLKHHELVGMVGDNGSGKTTTLRAISGLQKINSGQIYYKGRDISDLPTHLIVKSGISHCPAERQLFPRMSVRENLEMGMYLYPSKREEGLGLAFELFPVLKERIDQRAGSLSGGEQQLCAMARALMSRPELLLLDEPTLGLNQKVLGPVIRAISQINEKGVSVLLVEQNIPIAASLCNRAYLMDGGRIAAEDSWGKEEFNR